MPRASGLFESHAPPSFRMTTVRLSTEAAVSARLSMATLDCVTESMPIPAGVAQHERAATPEWVSFSSDSQSNSLRATGRLSSSVPRSGRRLQLHATEHDRGADVREPGDAARDTVAQKRELALLRAIGRRLIDELSLHRTARRHAEGGLHRDGVSPIAQRGDRGSGAAGERYCGETQNRDLHMTFRCRCLFSSAGSLPQQLSQTPI